MSSALSVAEASWKRGDRPAALKALRNAVEAASDAEDDSRALELAKAAADLTTYMASIPPPAPPSRGPLPPKSPSMLPPRPVPGAKPTPLKVAAAAQKGAKEESKKADRRSLAGEVSRGRAAPSSEDRTEPIRVPHIHHDPSPGPARKKAMSRGDRGKRLSRTDEIDAWPTESVKGDLPRASEVPPPPAVPKDAPMRSPSRGWTNVRASQAARVRVWRDADGTVRVASLSAPAPADAIEAVLAALEPDADLATLLSDSLS